MFYIVQLLRLDNKALEHIQAGLVNDCIVQASDVIAKIDDGRAGAWAVFKGRERIGTIVLSYARFSAGEVLNIECAASDRGDIDTVQAVLPGLLEYARSKGCVAVAMETARPGLIEKSKKLGFEPVSTRCEVKL